MLDSPLPTRRQGDIRLPSQAARIAICGRFPDPVRCVCWHCLLTKPDAYPTHGRSACCSGWFASWPGSQDGQRMSQTDFSDSLQPAGHCDRVPPIQTMPMRLKCCGGRMRSRHDGNSTCSIVLAAYHTAQPSCSALHLAASKRVAHHSPQPSCTLFPPEPDQIDGMARRRWLASRCRRRWEAGLLRFVWLAICFFLLGLMQYSTSAAVAFRFPASRHGYWIH